MAGPKLDPTQHNKAVTLSVRLTRADYERVKQLAQHAERPITSEVRRLIRAALAQRRGRDAA